MTPKGRCEIDLLFGGASLPHAATAWAATPSSGDTPQRPDYSVSGQPLAGRLMLRPPTHCPPTENVLPFPKAAIPLARAIWETTREQGMKLRTPLAPERGKTPFRCAALCHCSTPSLHDLIFALSKGRSRGSAPPPFHRRQLSAPFSVRWCARPFLQSLLDMAPFLFPPALMPDWHQRGTLVTPKPGMAKQRQSPIPAAL